ncbi:MAG: Ppx/GppA family phosphatase [Rhodomicrobium sp.]|nr:Ppx/GppA family phosphatase [Rhodomicrobium sp.]
MDWRGKIFTQTAEPVAVIDIGSNSIRLVVYEDEVRSPTPLLNEKILCGLGRKRTPQGGLNKAAAARALASLRRFNKLCEQTRVKRTYAFATEAVRSAADGAEFIAEAERACGCTIRVLSGREEAELAAAGILSGFIDPDGFVGDLGGGSLELIDLAGRQIRHEVSVPLGSLNLMETAGKDFAKAAAIVDAHLQSIPWLENGARRPFYLIGGTWRSVARLNMMETSYPLSVTHNYTMSLKQLDALFEAVLSRNPTVKTLDRISRDRREMLPYGLLLLKKLATGSSRPRSFCRLSVCAKASFTTICRSASRRSILSSRPARTWLQSGRDRSTIAMSSSTGPTGCFKGRVLRKPRKIAACAARPACSSMSAGAAIPTIGARRRLG